MNLQNIELPSNKKFGFFFCLVFLFLGIYFYFKNSQIFTYIFFTLGLTFFFITLLRASILLPINKLWMRFGLLIGIIVRPIVLGIIFFGLFTPISVIMRIIGRDELKLRFIRKKTYWISKNLSVDKKMEFKNQY